MTDSKRKRDGDSSSGVRRRGGFPVRNHRRDSVGRSRSDQWELPPPSEGTDGQRPGVGKLKTNGSKRSQENELPRSKLRRINPDEIKCDAEQTKQRLLDTVVFGPVSTQCRVELSENYSILVDA